MKIFSLIEFNLVPLEIGALVEDSGIESRGRIKATLLATRSAGTGAVHSCGTAAAEAKRAESPEGQQEEDDGNVAFCEAVAIAKDSLFRRFHHRNRYQDSTLTCR